MKRSDSERKIILVWVVAFFLLLGLSDVLAEESQSLFKKYKDTIYQIRVIELGSGNKSSIGSGFQITGEGHIATNYHVVSDVIKTPDKYRVEFVQHDGKTGTLQILDVDVVHDLAITIRNNESTPFLSFRKSKLPKGSRIFSVGNPFDLGMTIVEGTYNGLLKKSLYKKILFSGSLNPGMSGGPAIDEKGGIVGVNVSTKGNQLSFLVPAEQLVELVNRVKKNGNQPTLDYKKRIEEQLVKNQTEYMNKLISPEWEVLPLGAAYLPGEISSMFKCWGETDERKETLYEHTYTNCSTGDVIYLNSQLRTGKIQYTYHWYLEKGLDRFRFFNMYEDFYENWTGLNFAIKDDVTEYECNTNFVDAAGKIWKGVFCVREYKDYPALHDIFLNMALVSENDQGLILILSLSGVTKKAGLDFSKKFLRSIQWQN